MFSTILSLTEAQNPAYLFTKRKFRKQSFRKPALFFPPFNARRIFPAHDTNNPTNSLRKDGSPPSPPHACRCSRDKRRPAPVHNHRLAVLPSLARHLIPKALAPNDDILRLILVERLAYLRRHNACRRRAERICCLP